MQSKLVESVDYLYFFFGSHYCVMPLLLQTAIEAMWTCRAVLLVTMSFSRECLAGSSGLRIGRTAKFYL